MSVRKVTIQRMLKSFFKEELVNKNTVTGDADSVENEANKNGYEVNQNEQVVIVSLILHTL